MLIITLNQNLSGYFQRSPEILEKLYSYDGKFPPNPYLPYNPGIPSHPLNRRYNLSLIVSSFNLETGEFAAGAIDSLGVSAIQGTIKGTKIDFIQEYLKKLEKVVAIRYSRRIKYSGEILENTWKGAYTPEDPILAIENYFNGIWELNPSS